MIVSDTHRFAFMHIPKCGGTTVRNALAPYDEAAERYFETAVDRHPALGLLDHAHLPLAVVRDHFPEDFARLTSYRSFALLRDPFQRFPSSLHERFVQRDRISLSEREPNEIAREIDLVLDRLANHPSNAPITDPELIHFARQHDYVYLDGEQIIDTPRTLAEITEVFSLLSELIGKPVSPGQGGNQRLQYSSFALARITRAVTRPLDSVLPTWLWRPIYTSAREVFIRTGLARKGGAPISELPNFEAIQAFIAEFYAEDIRLFQKLDAESQNRRDSGAPSIS